jgi:hypothetical protein
MPGNRHLSDLNSHGIQCVKVRTQIEGVQEHDAEENFWPLRDEVKEGWRKLLNE